MGGEEKATTIEKYTRLKDFPPTNERGICKNSCQNLVGVAKAGGGGGGGSGVGCAGDTVH